MGLEVVAWSDQASWDAFIGSQKTGSLNQGWAWGDVINLLGARAIRRAVTQDGQIKAAMTIASNEIRHTGKRILYLNRGPAVDEPSPEIFGLLVAELERVAESEQALGVRIEPYVPTEDRTWPSLFHKFGFSPLFPPSQPRSQWMIDLEPSLDEVQAGMKSKWRYNIRLAAKKNVKLDRGDDSDVPAFYKLYQETGRRDGFAINDEQFYRRLFGSYWQLGQFDLLIARLDDQPIAAITLVTLGLTCWYLFGASSTDHRDVMAGHALQWEAMKIAKQRGAILYDMRGVADVPGPDQDMTGVYRFKQGFGGRHVTLMEQYAKGYQRPLYDLWKAYWQGRHMYVTLQRRRQGLLHRTWA